MMEFDPGDTPFGLTDFHGSLLLLLSRDGTGNVARIIDDGATLTLLTEFVASTPYATQSPVVVGGVAYFGVQHPGASELWITDGSEAGTRKLADLAGTSTKRVLAATVLPASHFLLVGDGSTTFLVVTDGTPEGTESLGAIAVTDPNGTSAAVTFEDRAYFSVNRTGVGLQLLRSDGSAASLAIVADLAPVVEFAALPAIAATPWGLYFSGWSASSGFELRRIAPGELAPRLVHDIAPGAWSSRLSDLTVLGSRIYFTAEDGIHGRQIWTLDPLAGACVEAADAICLEDGRFRVEARWRDFAGNQGVARPVRLSGDTGYFWFFDEENVELVLKVLDGTGTNGHHWVYYGALSNVEYNVTVTDAGTGAALRIQNPALHFASDGDITAFGPQGAHARGEVVLREAVAGAQPGVSELVPAPAAAVGGSCVPSPTRFCILGGRFGVEATWRDFEGHTGVAKASTLTDDTGSLWFFDESNVEVVLKAVDGSGFNGHFWIYYGALSNVEYEITVTDTFAGTTRRYRNPLGAFGSFGDIEAFPAP
jgi:ELWxxDGT repeat protein